MESVEFEFVPHTADIAIRARARDLRALARALALGLSAAVLERESFQPYRVAGILPRQVRCEGSPDEEGLIVDFLNELLFHMEIQHEVYSDVEVLDCRPAEGVAALAYPDPSLQAVRAVKAATHHGASLRRENGGVELTVVFDV